MTTEECRICADLGTDDVYCRYCFEKLQKRCKELEDALHWYVRHDDTNEGGEWEVANGMWLAGKRRAMRLLGLEVVVPS